MMKVHIENFQSIDRIDFEIDGFTVVSGKTNIGKTAIMRAIFSALSNESVKSTIRDKSKPVIVHISGDHDILWTKKFNGQSDYVIDGQSYEKVKGKLDKISEIGFGSLSVMNEKVYPWYASQWNPLFLLDSHGSYLTEFMSNITRLDTIQNAIRISIGRIKIMSMKRTIEKDEVDKLESKISAFDGFDKLKQLNEQINEQKKAAKRDTDELDIISDHRSNLIKLDMIIDAISIEKDVPSIDDKIYESFIKTVHFRDDIQKIDSLLETIDLDAIKIPDLNEDEVNQIVEVTKLSEQLDQVLPLTTLLSNDIKIPDLNEDEVNQIVEVTKLSEQLDRLDTFIEQIDPIDVDVNIEVNNDLGIIKQLSSELMKLDGEIYDESNKLIKLNDDISQLDEKISAIPVCETCGRPL